VYYGGEYHLFYQHDPYNLEFGGLNLHWGHAVSKDLVHWTELSDAIYPEGRGGIASGSAVVDHDNSAGFQTGNEKPIIAIFTDIHSSRKGQYDLIQGIAYSNDRGRTWTKYKNNPVLPNITKFNRDPKVIWYAPEKKWVMVLFLDQADYSKHPDVPPEKLLTLFADRSGFGLFSSRDLKTWEKMSEIKIQGEAECPEFFEIAVDGNAGNTRWITYGASGRYLIGTFDGRTFTRESGPHVIHSGNCFYASQTFNNIPATDGRRILIPWGRDNDAPTTPLYKGMPFNQMMGIPVELTLRTTADAGLRLFVVPAKDLESLRITTRNVKPQQITVGENPLATINGELFDLTAVITVGGATKVIFILRGVPVTYDVKAQELSCNGKTALLKAEDGKIRLRMLVDRTSIDIFGNNGRLYMPMTVAVDARNTSLQLRAEGRGAFISTLDVSELKSIWT
jgi:sucrose-6-phosphate hydrolase SacC (GH32 family)